MQKHVNLVDLVKSFPTNIYLQNLASIQKRTSPVKFAHLGEKSDKCSISNLSTKVETAKLEGTRDFSATKVKFELKLHGRHGHGRGRGQPHVGSIEVDLDSVGPYPISFDDYVVFLDAEIAVRGLEEADLLEELVQDPNSEGNEWIKGLDQNGTKTEHLEHEAAWDAVWSEHEVVDQ